MKAVIAEHASLESENSQVNESAGGFSSVALRVCMCVACTEAFFV